MGEKFDISVINDAEEYVGINAQRTWSLCQGDLFRFLRENKMSSLSKLHLLGTLTYMQKSRIDIATPVSFSSCYSDKPAVGASAELLQILQYLQHTK
jgi:hypothetical protein